METLPLNRFPFLKRMMICKTDCTGEQFDESDRLSMYRKDSMLLEIETPFKLLTHASLEDIKRQHENYQKHIKEER